MEASSFNEESFEGPYEKSSAEFRGACVRTRMPTALNSARVVVRKIAQATFSHHGLRAVQLRHATPEEKPLVRNEPDFQRMGTLLFVLSLKIGFSGNCPQICTDPLHNPIQRLRTLASSCPASASQHLPMGYPQVRVSRFLRSLYSQKVIACVSFSSHALTSETQWNAGRTLEQTFFIPFGIPRPLFSD